jgi:hypothetical protein
MNSTVRSFSRTGIITAVVLCIVGWAILRSGLLAATLTATWSYDYSLSPPCSAAQPVDCIDHFEVLDITNQEKQRVIEIVQNPPASTGKTEGIAARFKYGPPYGELTISVVALKRQKDGTLIGSNPYAARATVRLRPGVKSSVLFF